MEGNKRTEKILIVRFSSIGDIVLTTPVIRAIKEQKPGIQIHYLTKKSYASLLASNPHLTRLWTIDKSIDELIPELKQEGFTCIVDLHNNLRTRILGVKLGLKTYRFPKLNIQKWLAVNTPWNWLPDLHVVDRYYQAVAPLGVVNSQQPGELFIAEHDRVNPTDYGIDEPFVAVALGAQFKTKVIPKTKLVEILSAIKGTVVLLGGPTDAHFGNELVQELANHPGLKVILLAGELNLMQSASLLSKAQVLLTGDTGLMHIAACFSVRIVSVWGNTVPELGMYAYYPGQSEHYSIHQVEGLNCRPCSKIGFQSCPKKHFNCMMQQDAQLIATDVQSKIG